MSVQQVWTILSRAVAVSPGGMLHNVPSNTNQEIWKQLKMPVSNRMVYLHIGSHNSSERKKTKYCMISFILNDKAQ